MIVSPLHVAALTEAVCILADVVDQTPVHSLEPEGEAWRYLRSVGVFNAAGFDAEGLTGLHNFRDRAIAEAVKFFNARYGVGSRFLFRGRSFTTSTTACVETFRPVVYLETVSESVPIWELEPVKTRSENC